MWVYFEKIIKQKFIGENHNIFTEEVSLILLSANDDKIM